MTHGAQIGCFATGCSTAAGWAKVATATHGKMHQHLLPALPGHFRPFLNSYICFILRSYERLLAATQSGRIGSRTFWSVKLSFLDLYEYKKGDAPVFTVQTEGKKYSANKDTLKKQKNWQRLFFSPEKLAEKVCKSGQQDYATKCQWHTSAIYVFKK